jgi:hypothetical protein
MIEKIKDLYFKYYDLIMEWYKGLDQLAQYGVIIALVLVGFGAAVMFILSKLTK